MSNQFYQLSIEELLETIQRSEEIYMNGLGQKLPWEDYEN